MKYVIRPLLLLLVLGISFFVATALFDSFEHAIGYYDKSMNEAAEVGR